MCKYLHISITIIMIFTRMKWKQTSCLGKKISMSTLEREGRKEGTGKKQRKNSEQRNLGSLTLLQEGCPLQPSIPADCVLSLHWKRPQAMNITIYKTAAFNFAVLGFLFLHVGSKLSLKLDNPNPFCCGWTVEVIPPTFDYLSQMQWAWVSSNGASDDPD